MSTSTRPEGAVPSWHEDSIYSESIADPADIVYVGSDDEDYDTPDQRRQRYIEAGYRFLQGKRPTLLTAALHGPFDGRWKNPWQSQEKASQSKTTTTTVVQKTSAIPVGEKYKLPVPDAPTHLPSPESLKQTSAAPTPRRNLEEHEIDYLKQWKPKQIPGNASMKRKAESSEWLKTLPEKRQKAATLNRGESFPDAIPDSDRRSISSNRLPLSQPTPFHRTLSQTEVRGRPACRATQSFSDLHAQTTPTSRKRKSPPSRRLRIEDESDDELSQGVTASSPCATARQTRTTSKRVKPMSARPSTTLGTKTGDRLRQSQPGSVSGSTKTTVTTRTTTRRLTRSRVRAIAVDHSSPCKGPAQRAEEKMEIAAEEEQTDEDAGEEQRSDLQVGVEVEAQEPLAEEQQTDAVIRCEVVAQDLIDKPLPAAEMANVVGEAENDSTSDLSDVESDFGSVAEEMLAASAREASEPKDNATLLPNPGQQVIEQSAKAIVPERLVEQPAEAVNASLDEADQPTTGGTEAAIIKEEEVEGSRDDSTAVVDQPDRETHFVANKDAVAASTNESISSTIVSLPHDCVQDEKSSVQFSFTSLLPKFVSMGSFPTLTGLVNRGTHVVDPLYQGVESATIPSIFMGSAESPVPSIEGTESSDGYVDASMEMSYPSPIVPKEEEVAGDISGAEPIEVEVAQDESAMVEGDAESQCAAATDVETHTAVDVSMCAPATDAMSIAQQTETDTTMDDRPRDATASAIDFDFATEPMSISFDTATVASEATSRPPRPATPTEPQFSFKSISCFMSPSPRKKQRSRPSTSHRSTSFRNPLGVNKSSMKNRRYSRTSAPRVSWAELPEQLVFDAQARIRASSPPPVALGQAGASGDDKFRQHFNAMAKRTYEMQKRKRGLVEPTTSNVVNVGRRMRNVENDVGDDNVVMSSAGGDEEMITLKSAKAKSLTPANEGDVEMGMDTQDLLDDVLNDMEGLLDVWDVDQQLDQARKDGGGYAMSM